MICVEGPIAAGKSNFAKELADELEMLYVSAPTMDDAYINSYGFDYRTLDDKLPEGAKTFDNKKWCINPKHRLSGAYQLRMYMLRTLKYVDALAHILSTGQGVVCNRSPFSDYVFLEAMLRNDYLSNGVRSVYYDVKANTITELMRPHLVIYLDVPVAKVKENIKKRNIDYEIKSPAFTDKYLQDIENGYKQKFLKEISAHSELLIYDWTEAGEPEVVVEDIERIDFDRFGHYDDKLEDWRIMTEWEWCEKRMEYTVDRHDIISYFNVPRWDVPELIMNADDAFILEEVYDEAPGNKYAPGYNADMGDSGILTKTKEWFHYRT
jgi:NADH dehydrogenase (ubiquinone) 1 alpha subcomplex subunit 10